MIRKGHWKYIEYPDIGLRQLFDLKADPDELTNLAESRPHAQRRADLQSELRKWLKEHGDPLFAEGVPGNSD